MEKTEGEPLVLPSSGVERTGYELIGWNTQPDGSGDSYNLGGTYSKDRSCIFYAVWKPIEYTIEYDLNGGNLEAGWPEFYTIETEIRIKPVPTKSRCIFLGWSEDGSESSEAISIAKGSTGDRVFKADWRPAATYGIHYYGNGGEREVYGPEMKYEDEDFALMSEKDATGIFKKADYELVGWNTMADGKGDGYELGGTYKKNEDCKFYAVWKAVEYGIKYDYNGAVPKEGTEPSKTTYTIEDLPLTLESPTLKNRTFIGWSLSSGERVSEIPMGTTGGIVLTAVWELLPYYTITYDYGDGLETETRRYSDDPELVIEDCTGNKEGYVFSHWYSDDGTVYMPGDSYSAEANLKLHAYWVQECLSFGSSVHKGKDAYSVSYRNDYTGEIKSIKIPALYKGKTVDSIPENGFSGCPMESVVISDSINYISKNAFNGCSSLTSLKLPSGVSVWGYAFANCTKLETLTLSAGVKFQSSRAFSECRALEKIFVEGQVSSLGSETFYHCSSIVEIDFGETQLKWSDDGMKAAKVRSGVRILVGGELDHVTSFPE